MSKKCKVNWSDIDGASPKPKRLHLEKDETDSLYHCPIQECDHDGFQSQRGCRKHVNTKHSWFFYFDEKPSSKDSHRTYIPAYDQCLKSMSSEYFSSEQVVSGSTKTLETLWNINELIGRIINFCDTILNRQLSLVYPSHPSHYKELTLNENSKKEYQLKQLFVLRCFRCIRHTQQIIGFSVRSQ